MSLSTAGLRAGTLVEQIAYAIERGILDGELPPGAQLRQEELCANLGVSRTPVREALRRLQADGLVELRANHTTWVRRMDRAAVVDLYDVRASLEAWACERAAARLTSADMVALEGTQAALEIVSAEIVGLDADLRDEAQLHEELREANDRFHIVIHRASGSPLLAELISRLWARFPKDYVWRTLVREEDSLALNSDQHRQIMAAFAARRPGQAARAMKDHVKTSGDLLIGHLDRHGFWGSESRNRVSRGGNRRA
jgi:DNA-binding GntR family transcriptional regulator